MSAVTSSKPSGPMTTSSTGKIAELITSGAKIALGYAEQSLKGIEGHMFARRPTWGMGGQEIECNHAAFVYGHLAVYPPRIVAMVGGAGGVGGSGNTGTPAVPGTYEALFKAGVACKDDPHGDVYPAMDEIVRVFFEGQKAAIAAVERMSDADLTRTNTTGAMQDRLPTIGAVVNFLLNDHVMMHLGQLSTWRRCMGLGSVF